MKRGYGNDWDGGIMNIAKQKQLVMRIQANLRKESGKHYRSGNNMAGADCAEQALSLKYVIGSLTTLAQVALVVEVIASLLPSNSVMSVNKGAQIGRE